MKKAVVLVALGLLGCSKDSSTGPSPVPITIVWSFCDPTRIPLWFAYQDGTGVWTQVQPTASAVYSFNLDHGSGGVAWVTNGPWTEVYYATAAELVTAGAGWCATHPDRSKTLEVSVAGIGTGDFAQISMGPAAAGIGVANFQIPLGSVPPGPQDLIARKFGNGPAIGIIRRGLDLPNNSVVPVLDFSAAEAFLLLTATVTVANANGDPTSVQGSYVTAHGTSLVHGDAFATRTAPDVIYGIPASASAAGDLYLLSVSTLRGVSTRTVARGFATFGDQSVTLGPDLTLPTRSTVATTPYLRLRGTGPIQAAYSSTIKMTWQQALGVTGSPVATVATTKGYLGSATSYDLSLPDFSAVGGWQNTWGLQPGAATFWFLNASGTNGVVRDGYLETSAAAGGQMTP